LEVGRFLGVNHRQRQGRVFLPLARARRAHLAREQAAGLPQAPANFGCTRVKLLIPALDSGESPMLSLGCVRR
jgi:hypothetical protein